MCFFNRNFQGNSLTSNDQFCGSILVEEVLWIILHFLAVREDFCVWNITPFDLVRQTLFFLIWTQPKTSLKYYYLYFCQILQWSDRYFGIWQISEYCEAGAFLMKKKNEKDDRLSIWCICRCKNKHEREIEIITCAFHSL